MDTNDDIRFIDGWLAACQNIAITHGEDSIAVELLSEFDEDILLRAQKRTGFESRKMNRLIREAHK